MSELPKGWQTSTVGECFLEVKNGTTATQNKLGSGIPVSRIETIQNNRFDLNRIQHIESPSDELVEVYKYQEGDIAFSHINSFEHVGKTALYEGKPKTLIHGMNLLRLRRGHECISPKFAHYFMLSNSFREEVRKRVGHAVNQVSINQKSLSAVPFILAPLHEQSRIVAKLEKLLSRVDAAQGRLATLPRVLKRFRQSVLAAACSGRLTADWRATQLRPLHENEELPDSWEVSTVSTITKIGSGQTSKDVIAACKSVGEVAWFKVSDMNLRGNETFMGTSQNYLSEAQVKRLRLKVFPAGSIIFPKRGGAIATNKKRRLIEPSCLDLNLMVLTPDEDLQEYLWIWFSTIDLGSLSDGSNVPQINNTDILPLEVPLPPPNEQQEIVRRVDALLKTADALEARYRKAKAQVDKLTQSILAKAFRGELVPQDPNDEPASVLLERIKQKLIPPKVHATKRRASLGKA